jgi:hypothetical protein
VHATDAPRRGSLVKLGSVLWRYALLPALVALGAFAVASGLVEGPALQPFLYGVF